MLGGYYGIDSLYLILVMPAIIFTLWAQSKVQSTFARYHKVPSDSGFTGAEVARRILDDNGLYNVRVEHIKGSLNDHYDPREKVVRLSDSVHGSGSIAALGVAAHETGHAVQHATGYRPLTLRNAIIPVTDFGSRLSFPLILFGLLLNNYNLVGVGIVCFAMVTLFQLITLPVEFDASARALRTLDDEHILRDDEVVQAKKVLTAAALTYVAALIVSAVQLLRYVLIFSRRRR